MYNKACNRFGTELPAKRLDTSALMLRYIQRIDEMERIIRFLEEELTKAMGTNIFVFLRNWEIVFRGVSCNRVLYPNRVGYDVRVWKII